MEGGFQLLISLVHKFSNNPTIFLLVCAFITNGLVLLAIYRMSDNVFLSVYFYVALYYYFISYNALRQYLAVAVLLNAFWYAKQKKWIKYAIMMLIAVSLHTVAIVGLIYIPIFLGNDEVVSKKEGDFNCRWWYCSYTLIGFPDGIAFSDKFLNTKSM